MAGAVSVAIDRNEDVLSSKIEIMQYLQWTPYMFEMFRAYRFPARQVNGRWYASKIKLDQWWQVFCTADSSSFPNGGE
jgi:hypothetical protein